MATGASGTIAVFYEVLPSKEAEATGERAEAAFAMSAIQVRSLIEDLGKALQAIESGKSSGAPH